MAHPEDTPATDPFNPENWDFCGDCDGVIACPPAAEHTVEADARCRCTYTEYCGVQIVATPTPKGYEWSLYWAGCLVACRDAGQMTGVASAGWAPADNEARALGDARRYIDTELER